MADRKRWRNLEELVANIELDPGDIEWTRNLWESLNEGGEWTIPRSGAVFRKEGNTLVHIRGFSMEALHDAIQVKLHADAIGVEFIGQILLGGAMELDPVDSERRKGAGGR